MQFPTEGERDEASKRDEREVWGEDKVPGVETVGAMGGIRGIPGERRRDREREG